MSNTNRNILIIGLGLILLFAFVQGDGGGGGFTAGEKPSVFIVYDPKTKSTLPGSMVDSWDSEEVATWMAENAEDFIVQNKDADFSDERYAKFKDVIAKYPPERYPWCYISNGRKGAQGDPPIDGKSLIAETKKWVSK